VQGRTWLCPYAARVGSGVRHWWASNCGKIPQMPHESIRLHQRLWIEYGCNRLDCARGAAHASHACCLATAFIFCWPVVQPWPRRPVVPPWGIVLYLILADLQNTVLSAWLVFAERVINPSYAAVSHPWGISALNDQAAAGAIMWVPGSVAFLVPIAWTVGQLLSPQGPHIAVLGHQHVVDGGLRRGCTQKGEE
jgi:hypothetical protein